MGATKTSKECDQINTDKILSFASLVLKISTEFSSSSEDVLMAQVDSGKLTTLNDAWNSIKSTSVVQNALKAYDAANRLVSGYRAIEDLVKEVSTTKDFYLTCDKVVDPDACISED
ncbi:hypothetical protein H310_11626 [Aphanomyces invadans]|uniref:Uncharacterized protein n=1 Tax=Aphanomyces invadans TaxID=157072 RepID=A0A024TMZ5_9STRA|nr:hypothetical protein H310_11626 [Aphanomyces invadans]ETV94986.1 hypothetical protein H310_11626 [Aphanomyces invadans]|eukprot:XP_008876577.1 hypothetical protein H310_11626 [Aphanomyces invadans]